VIALLVSAPFAIIVRAMGASPRGTEEGAAIFFPCDLPVSTVACCEGETRQALSAAPV